MTRLQADITPGQKQKKTKKQKQKNTMVFTT